MSRKPWTQEQKKAWSEKCKAGANKHKTSWSDEQRLVISQRRREKAIAQWTPENRLKHSQIMLAAVTRNPESYSKHNVSGRVKIYEVQSSTGITKVKGKWELAVANYLNENQISWTNNIKPFNYTWQDKWHLYFPDFLLLDKNVYIEVKGYKTDRDEAKWSVVENLIIIDHSNIKSLSTILSV